VATNSSGFSASINQKIPFSQDMLMAGVADLLDGVGGLTTSVLQGNEVGSDYAFKAQEASLNAQEAGLTIKELWNKEIFDEGMIERRGAAMAGGERAAQAAQGLGVSSRASMQIPEETAKITGRDIFTLRNNAYMKAFGYKAQQMEDMTESQLNTIKSNEAKQAGLFGGLAKFAGSALRAAPELGA